MSSTRAGVSTLSFIRSISVVPPPMNRTSAPCCAVFDCAAAAMAAAESLGRMNSKVCMVSPMFALSVFPYLLNRRNDIRVGTAAADVAAHQFLHRSIVRAARFFEQRNGRHDLSRRAVPALIAVTFQESLLHRMQRFRRTESFDRRDLMPIVHEREIQTGKHSLAVHMHRAGTTLPVVTPLL